MSKNYDNWEKLVGAVLKREKFRQLALSDSMSSRSNGDESSCSSFNSIESLPRSLGLIGSTGKKCYMLRARELQIAWIDNPIYWVFTSLPESRFGEVAELLEVCWLDIRGVFKAQMLSPNTNYAAYLVFKLAENHYGLDCLLNASIKFVKQRWVRRAPVTNIDCHLPQSQTHGWLEIEVGEFFVGERDKSEIQVRISETKRLHWKGGLLVEGIELRPKEAL